MAKEGDGLSQGDNRLVDSMRQLTIEDEGLSQTDSQLSDSVHQLTIEDTSLYQPDSQESSSKTSSGNDQDTTSLAAKRLLLNDFLRSCDAGTVGPYKKKWEAANEGTRAGHVSKAKSLIVAGLHVITPGDAGYLWEAVRTSGSVEKELRIGEQQEERKYLEALSESYQNASCWETRRQILSIVVDLTTFKTIQRCIPGLTEYRFKMARLHSLQYGRGAEVPRTRSLRMRVESTQPYHFLAYITSSHVIQDLSFGQRYLRLSSRKILETPNVSRTMVPNRLAKQYQAYCEETGFTPFSPATMFRVLSACAATVRRSLQGLDYIAADGAKGFEDLCDMVEGLKEKGLDRDTAKIWEVSLKEGKQYLKADYKVMVTILRVANCISMGPLLLPHKAHLVHYLMLRCSPFAWKTEITIRLIKAGIEECLPCLSDLLFFNCHFSTVSRVASIKLVVLVMEEACAVHLRESK